MVCFIFLGIIIEFWLSLEQAIIVSWLNNSIFPLWSISMCILLCFHASFLLYPVPYCPDCPVIKVQHLCNFMVWMIKVLHKTYNTFKGRIWPVWDRRSRNHYVMRNIRERRRHFFAGFGVSRPDCLAAPVEQLCNLGKPHFQVFLHVLDNGFKAAQCIIGKHAYRNCRFLSSKNLALAYTMQPFQLSDKIRNKLNFFFLWKIFESRDNAIKIRIFFRIFFSEFQFMALYLAAFQKKFVGGSFWGCFR